MSPAWHKPSANKKDLMTPRPEVPVNSLLALKPLRAGLCGHAAAESLERLGPQLLR